VMVKGRWSNRGFVLPKTLIGCFIAPNEPLVGRMKAISQIGTANDFPTSMSINSAESALAMD